MRRPGDPAGRTVPPGLVPRHANDVLAILPAKPPKLRPGDRPLPGVDWELEELLGVGGFGEVWKARNRYLPWAKPVALKFCLDAGAAKVLRNEAQVLSQLMRQKLHPRIVSLHQTYLSADPPCLAYEYIEGGDLAGLIAERSRSGAGLKPELAADVIRRLADIVGSAHRLSPPVVHRDLKPANVLVSQGKGGGITLWVTDFGIGGVATGEAIRQTNRGTTRGEFLASALRGSCTPLYASPEQLRGERPDPRDDVFALGVLWHQLLIGDLTAGRPGGSQ
jgi:serine/threonine protein kinase